MPLAAPAAQQLNKLACLESVAAPHDLHAGQHSIAAGLLHMHSHLSPLRSLSLCSLPRSALPCLPLCLCLSRERLRLDLHSRQVSLQCCKSYSMFTSSSHVIGQARTRFMCGAMRVLLAGWHMLGLIHSVLEAVAVTCPCCGCGYGGVTWTCVLERGSCGCGACLATCALGMRSCGCGAWPAICRAYVSCMHRSSSRASRVTDRHHASQSVCLETPCRPAR